MRSAVGIVRSYRLDGPGLEYRPELQSFILFRASREDMWPNQLSFNCELGPLYPGVSCVGVSSSLNILPRLRISETIRPRTRLGLHRVYHNHLPFPYNSISVPKSAVHADTCQVFYFKASLTMRKYSRCNCFCNQSYVKSLTVCAQLNDRCEMDFTITARILLPSVCACVCVCVCVTYFYFYLETFVFDFRCNKHVFGNLLLAAFLLL